MKCKRCGKETPRRICGECTGEGYFAPGGAAAMIEGCAKIALTHMRDARDRSAGPTQAAFALLLAARWILIAEGGPAEGDLAYQQYIELVGHLKLDVLDLEANNSNDNQGAPS